MNVVKYLYILTVIALSILAGSSLSSVTNEGTAKTFCAYDRVFIEFEESGKRWGTLMLDWEGNPIPCSDDKLLVGSLKNI